MANAASGASFGTTLTVAVNVVAANPTPSACPFTPIIRGALAASATTIKPGESVTLSWGFVEGAQTAEIDNDIGGVSTPGSTTVNPTSTTTYTLTGRCNDKVATSSVTINVASATATATSTATATATVTQTTQP
jgi:hypothetical protein